MFILFSLDQLLVSVGDQQRLQTVLSSARSKSTILTLMQEAKAQSEVSKMERTRRYRTAATSVPRYGHRLRGSRALLQVSRCELTAQSHLQSALEAKPCLAFWGATLVHCSFTSPVGTSYWPPHPTLYFEVSRQTNSKQKEASGNWLGMTRWT